MQRKCLTTNASNRDVSGIQDSAAMDNAVELLIKTEHLFQIEEQKECGDIGLVRWSVLVLA